MCCYISTSFRIRYSQISLEFHLMLPGNGRFRAIYLLQYQKMHENTKYLRLIMITILPLLSRFNSELSHNIIDFLVFFDMNYSFLIVINELVKRALFIGRIPSSLTAPARARSLPEPEFPRVQGRKQETGRPIRSILPSSQLSAAVV